MAKKDGQNSAVDRNKMRQLTFRNGVGHNTIATLNHFKIPKVPPPLSDFRRGHSCTYYSNSGGVKEISTRSLQKTKSRKSKVQLTKQLTSSRSHEGRGGRSRINQYELGERLGQGSYGTVRTSTDLDSMKVYAVKIIPRRQFRQAGK